MKLTWHQTKNKVTFKEAYAQESVVYKSKWKAFWSALDIKCEGNIVYDFYWWFVWSNISRLIGVPKALKQKQRMKKQRLDDGFTDEDIWGWDEVILEFFDKGFTKFVIQIWGRDVASWTDEQWKKWSMESYPRKFYNKIVDFQKNMEGLRHVRKEMEELKYPENYKLGDPLPEDYHTALFNLTNDETLCLDSAWKNLVYILDKYHYNLWS